ncbi:SAG family member [Eimeria mitis]|uniref:SAG family member n=1 Tax=Eimeria mitis TaxID=44415 RepID=U6KED8_9EIME|nr:SAG family member [Eimeria mitis]CDJ34617.1 SAG family member [Eimeria mitis]
MFQTNCTGGDELSRRDVCILRFSAGTAGVCLDEINAAREKAGLTHFKVASDGEHQLPKAEVEEADPPHTSPWDPVCKALIEEEAEKPQESRESNGFNSGTYAFMALESETPDCAAAVNHWKDAANNFTTIPPPKKNELNLYDKQQNVSFIALYNPSNNAAADCRVVTCTRPAASEFTTIPPPKKNELNLYDKQQNVSFIALYNPSNNPAADCRVVTCTRPAASDNSPSNFRSTAEEKKGYALLCMTTPEALKDNEAPFTEEQWNKIKASLTGSASAVAPSLLAVAIAALGLLAL